VDDLAAAMVQQADATLMVKLTWTDRAAYQPDEKWYRLFKVDDQSASPPAASGFTQVFEIQVDRNRDNYTINDHSINEGSGNYSHYFIRTEDEQGNSSGPSNTVSIETKDTTVPSPVTSITTNGTATHNGTITITSPPDKEAKFRWTDPTDADLRWVKVWKNATVVTGKPSIAWADGDTLLVAEVPVGTQAWKDVDLQLAVNVQEDHWYFFTTMDRAGNEDMKTCLELLHTPR
jgi:hypothetical protein